MIIAVDFDGTIIEDNAYPDMGSMIPGADKALRQWKKDGHIIIMNSCRTGRYEADAVDFMLDNGIPFDYFNCNHPMQIEFYKMDSRKISADIYIDDKQLGGLPSWEEIDKLVKQHPRYYENVSTNYAN